MGLKERRWLFFGVAFAVYCLVRDCAFLFASPYPYGIDGYYYTALAEGAAVGRSDSPLLVGLLRLFTTLMSPASAAKVSGLLLLYGTGFAAFALIRALSRSMPLAFLAFFLVVKGFMRAELLVNFPKQLLGHLILLLLAWCVLRSASKSPFKPVACAALLVAASLAHSLSLALCALLIASVLTLRLLQRTPLRRPLTAYLLLAWIAPWAFVFAAAAWPALAGPRRHLVWLSTSVRPRFNVPFLYDGVSPISLFFPTTFFETLALCIALGVCCTLAWRLDIRQRHTLQIRRLWMATAAFMPQVALTFCPFFVGGHIYTVGIHYRLVAALGVAAAVVVPAAIAACPLTRARRGILAAAFVAPLALLPPAWPPSVLPMNDGGALHRAMVSFADEVPGDAVIITTLRTGNMVNALWGRPRVIATRYEPDLSRANYYRLTVFDPAVAAELDAYAALHNEFPPPRTVLGPWRLVKEELYFAFRKHLRETSPELVEKLVD